MCRHRVVFIFILNTLINNEYQVLISPQMQTATQLFPSTVRKYGKKMYPSLTGTKKAGSFSFTVKSVGEWTCIIPMCQRVYVSHCLSATMCMCHCVRVGVRLGLGTGSDLHMAMVTHG